MTHKKWEFVNHGGMPTTNESKKYAIFVGRFQPYHQGHISLIQQKLNEVEQSLSSFDEFW